MQQNMFKEGKLLHGHKQTVLSFLKLIHFCYRTFLLNHVENQLCVLDKKYRESTSFEKAMKYQHQLLSKKGEGKM